MSSTERSEHWTPERRADQRERAQQLVAQGRFGGAGRGQGRKRRPRLQITWGVVCPGCGAEIRGKETA